MAWFYKKCFKTGGDKLVDKKDENYTKCVLDDRRMLLSQNPNLQMHHQTDINFLAPTVPLTKANNRILSSNLLKKSMKYFDQEFRIQKGFNQKDFKHLRRLFKKKFIQRRLKIEGKPLNIVVKNNVSFDIGKVDLLNTKSGFTPIRIDRTEVVSADIEDVLKGINEEDINEVDGIEEAVKEDNEDDDV